MTQQERELKQIMLKTFRDNVSPDTAGREAHKKAASEAAKIFGVKKPTNNQLKAYLLFGEDAALIKEDIRFIEET